MTHLPIADIIIPIAPGHQEMAQEAIASAHAQTLPARVIPQIDGDKSGAAATRNAGASRGNAPFIIFLDADDLLEPSFTEKCLAEWLKHEHGYVFTEWWRGDKIAGRNTYDDIFQYGMYHIITTLLPRRAFEIAGGFDATQPTLEDEDLYRRLWRSGLCAWRVAEPLVSYRADLGFSKPLRDKILDTQNAYFESRDGYLRGVFSTMCSCQENVAGGQTVSGSKMEGDILAMPLYTPRRMSSAVQPGRVYDTPMMGQPMWVNPKDVELKPRFWQPIAKREDINPDIDTVMRLAQGA